MFEVLVYLVHAFAVLAESTHAVCPGKSDKKRWGKASKEKSSSPYLATSALVKRVLGGMS